MMFNVDPGRVTVSKYSPPGRADAEEMLAANSEQKPSNSDKAVLSRFGPKLSLFTKPESQNSRISCCPLRWGKRFRGCANP
jgi:hypothetical protein